MASNAEHSALFAEMAAQRRPVVRDPPKFDLDSYISNYDGPARLSRLATIAYTSTYLSADAFKAAIVEAKQGKNVDFYLNMVDGLHKLAPDEPLGVPDLGWVDMKRKQVKAETERLEHELKTYKNNLIKESIRMGNEDLGAHYASSGDYTNAFKSYSRMREYCTTPKHIAEMSLKIMLVCINQQDWMNVQSQILKVQTNSSSLKPEERGAYETITSSIHGLAQMASGSYRDAAEEFLKVDATFISAEPVGGIDWKRAVLSANDIAVYGGLCALASMSRTELQTRVLSNATFGQFLELEPHIRRAIALFCSSKYSACLEILEQYRTDYLLDVYLQPHVAELYWLVRSKSIVQYFIPFSCVTLDEMARVFSSTSGAKIEDELVDMIQRGILDARIDLVNRLLISPSLNARTSVHASALTVAATYEKNLRLRLLRLNMQNAGLEVKAPKSHNTFNVGGEDVAGLGQTGGFEEYDGYARGGRARQGDRMIRPFLFDR